MTSLKGVREHIHGSPVWIDQDSNGRPCLTTSGKYEATAIDLLDLIAWLKENRPDLLNGNNCSG
jgi:hypothetical protein